MIKWAAVSVLVAVYLTASQGQIDEFIEDSNNIKTVDGLQCSKLEGTSTECLACYNCDHEKVKTTKKQIHKLQFSYSNCNKDELCCLLTPDLGARNTNSDCGIKNPQGNPRAQRPSLRSVLEREYPWRAWVYSNDKEEPLCAASYIDFRTAALLTTASCISGYQPSALRVKFTKTQEIAYLVKDAVIHEDFSNSTGGNINDIAMLALTEKPDKRVRSVCIEPKPAVLGSSCVVVSDSETYINVVMPQSTKCAGDNVKIENNVTCSYMVAGDYIPERGAGLYCLSEHFTPPAYILQGIYQSYQEAGPLAIYTSVSNFARWIPTTADLIRKSPH